MKISQFIALSVLAVSVLLIRKMHRSRVKQQTFNGISFNPTAIFILQNQPHHDVSRYLKYHREE